jgi:hypothetical protein
VFRPTDPAFVDNYAMQGRAYDGGRQRRRGPRTRAALESEEWDGSVVAATRRTLDMRHPSLRLGVDGRGHGGAADD